MVSFPSSLSKRRSKKVRLLLVAHRHLDLVSRAKNILGNVYDSLTRGWKIIGERPRSPGSIIPTESQYGVGSSGAPDDLGLKINTSLQSTLDASGSVEECQNLELLD